MIAIANVFGQKMERGNFPIAALKRVRIKNAPFPIILSSFPFGAASPTAVGMRALCLGTIVRLMRRFLFLSLEGPRFYSPGWAIGLYR